MTRLRTDRTTGFEKLILGVAALAAALVWWPTSPSTQQNAQQRQARFLAANDRLFDVTAMDRSLFDQSRRSSNAQATATPGARPAVTLDVKQRFTLTGVAQVGETAVAVFEERETKRSQRLQRGQVIADDWFLEDVTAITATIQNSSTSSRKTFKLKGADATQ
ncbi:MAG: hypothetical protein RL291_106 [Pseudomonadota bacterium]|jgi:hypothetical protein